MPMGEIYYVDRLISGRRKDLREVRTSSKIGRVNPGIETKITTYIAALSCYRQELMDEVGVEQVGNKYQPKKGR